MGNIHEDEDCDSPACSADVGVAVSEKLKTVLNGYRPYQRRVFFSCKLTISIELPVYCLFCSFLGLV